jgi:ElaB/YqjD/DUF883 family membrane-anchored ribosome-binding protein
MDQSLNEAKQQMKPLIGDITREVKKNLARAQQVSSRVYHSSELAVRRHPYWTGFAIVAVAGLALAAFFPWERYFGKQATGLDRATAGAGGLHS